MRHGDLAQAAALLGGAGSALVLLPLPRRPGLFAGFGLLVAAEAMLAVALVPRGDLDRLATPPREAALAVAVLAGVAAAAVLVRVPTIVPVAVLAAAPFRLPVDLGSQHAFLLLPLYGVLAAASLALLFQAARGDRLPNIPLWLAGPAAAFIAFDSLSLLWARDLQQGSIELLFFIFPFATLVAVVARCPFARWLPRSLTVVLVALATAFAVIGLYQAWTHTIFFAQDLRVANAYTTFFRVTSVFKDPSIYGRHLVLAISLLIVLLWLGRIRFAIAAPIVALIFAGLYFSYSQSSMAVLFFAVVIVTIALADRRSRNVVVAVALVAALAGSAMAVAAAKDHSLRRATSGRSRLVRVTLPVIRDHPVVGVGVGSQPLASKKASTLKSGAGRVSHTTPLTVAAELGAVGLLLYLAFLAGAANLLRHTLRRHRTMGFALATAFLVLVLHSLFYSGFFEDPLTWGILALASASLTVTTAGETGSLVAAAEPHPDSPQPELGTTLRSRVQAYWHT